MAFVCTRIVGKYVLLVQGDNDTTSMSYAKFQFFHFYSLLSIWFIFA